MGNVRYISIDPTNLSQEQGELLKAFLLSEEAKPKDNKTKKFEPNQPYLFTHNNQSYEITFSKKMVRRKKRYKQMIMLGPDDVMPRTKERNTLYFKKFRDGTVVVQTHQDAEPKELNENQLAALQDISKLNFDVPQTIKNNKDTHKQFSFAALTCGYDSKYIYQVLDTDKPLGKGAFGAVYNSPGKLEHGNNRMEYIDYQSARSVEEAHRGPRKAKVAKVQLVQSFFEEQNKDKIKSLDTENELWQRDQDSQTKKSTRIKDSQGFVAEDVMIQRKFEGVELAEIIKNNTLSPTECYELAISLLEALLKLHESNIIHRDIKPQNIMFDPVTKKIKIVDLGSAQDVASQDRRFLGSPIWIAPEQWARKKNLPAQQNDVYAMSLVIRELFGDMILQEKDRALTDISDISGYLSTGYYLNISMKKPELPPHVIAELGPEKTAQMTAVLYGMSMSKENERLPVKTALSILNENAPLPLEEKSYPHEVNQKQAKKAAKNFSYFSHEMKWLFLSEAAQRLEIYSQKIDFPDELRTLLDEYNKLIKMASQKSTIDDVTDLLNRTNNIFNTVKNITPENQDAVIDYVRQNLVHLQENLTKKEFVALSSAIDSVRKLESESFVSFLDEMEKMVREVMDLPNPDKELFKKFMIQFNKGLKDYDIRVQAGHLVLNALEKLESLVMQDSPIVTERYEAKIVEAAELMQRLGESAPSARLEACLNQSHLFMQKLNVAQAKIAASWRTLEGQLLELDSFPHHLLEEYNNLVKQFKSLHDSIPTLTVLKEGLINYLPQVIKMNDAILVAIKNQHPNIDELVRDNIHELKEKFPQLEQKPVEEEKEEKAAALSKTSTATAALILAKAKDGDATEIVKSSVGTPNVVTNAIHSSKALLHPKNVTEKSVEIEPAERATSKPETRRMG